MPKQECIYCGAPAARWCDFAPEAANAAYIARKREISGGFSPV